MRALVAERETGGRLRLAGGPGLARGGGRPALEKLAWSGAADGLAGEHRYARREALWRLGVAAPPVATGRHGTQLSLALDLPAAPSLDPLGDWDAMLADYATTGLTTTAHPLGAAAPRARRPRRR